MTVQVITDQSGAVIVTTTSSASVVSAHYRHVQSVASATWTFTHALGKYPSVSIVDTAGNMVLGNVKYISLTVVECSFSAAFSGEAYCN